MMTDSNSAEEAHAAEAVVELEFELAEPPAKVWRALTEPETVARWIRPEEASGPAVDYALVDTDPGRRVSYRWREKDALDSIVTFSIADGRGGGTRLIIVQTEATSAPVVVSGPVGCRFSFGQRSSTSSPRLAANLPFISGCGRAA